MFEKIKRDRERVKRDRLRDDMVIKMAKLKALIGEKHKSGWDAYEALVRDYIAKCKQRKIGTRIDIASPEDIHELRLLDHEIFILGFFIDIPRKYIERAEQELDKGRIREQRESNRQKA